MQWSLGPPSAGSGCPTSEASAAGISPERSEHCEAMSLEVCSMRGVATPVSLLLLLFSMLKTSCKSCLRRNLKGIEYERF